MNVTMEGSVLAVNDLRVTDSRGKALVRGVTLSVSEGETVGIVGESGSGKSVTLRAIMGILPETLHIAGDVTVAVTAGPFRPASMVFQEPGLALNPTMRVGNFLSCTWRKHHPDRSAMEAKAAAITLMNDVGIVHPETRYRAWPHELSGGMKQRIVIASALAGEPRLLLCDEATTALDVRVQAQILTLLSGLVRERGLAMVFVSHDLAVVASVCERIIVMNEGEVLEEGLTSDVLGAPQHPYTRALLNANLSRRRTQTPTEDTGR